MLLPFAAFFAALCLIMSRSNPFLQLFQQQPKLVRLAVLQPGEIDTLINITLTDVKPEETSYECISYDRADDDDTVEITVDDQKQAIPRRLETGLRAFRRKDRPRTLWADLLIGNDVEERSKQMGVMRTILENAERTLCWTGEANDKSAKAYEIIRTMGNRWTNASVKFGMPDSMTKATSQQMQNVLTELRSCPFNDLDSFNFGTWREIYDVFGSPYWKSVQCLPEIVLAKKAIIVCGRNNISWADFHHASKAVAVFQGKFFGGVPLLPKVMKGISIIHGIQVAERRLREGESIELYPMIMSARDADPKDPRECVFSMLPIVTPSARLKDHQGVKPTPPEVDYTKSVQAVFTDAARYIILERQDLMLWWSERAPCARRIKGLPSWVPDWSTGNGGSSHLAINNRLRAWTDSVTSRKSLRVTDDGKLHLQAYPLDKVVYVSPLFHAGNARRLAFKEWQKVEQLESDEDMETRKERFWRSLISDYGGMGTTVASFGKAPKQLGDSFKSLMAEEEMFEMLNCTRETITRPEVMARIDNNDPKTIELSYLIGKADPIVEAMRISTWGHRFFRTENGRFGLTTAEDYSMVDSTYRPETPEPATGATEPGDRIGGLMGDPMARAMMAGFQNFLLDRDPNAAAAYAKAMSGDLQLGEQTKTGGVDVGDIIVAAIGGFHPYVLRPVKNETEGDEAISSPASDSTYEFIGDCYLHGIMEGEPFTQTNWWLQSVFVTDLSKLVDIVIV